MRRQVRLRLRNVIHCLVMKTPSNPTRRRKRTIHPRAIRAGMRHESAWAGLGRVRWEACEEKGGGGHRAQARRGNAEFA